MCAQVPATETRLANEQQQSLRFGGVTERGGGCMKEGVSCPQSLAGTPPIPTCHLSWVLPQFCLAPSLATSFSNFFLDLTLTNPLAREACFGGT